MGCIPFHSDRKSHFILKNTHQILPRKEPQHRTSFISVNNYQLIKFLTFSNRRNNFSSTPEKIKRGGKQKNTKGWGTPSHSDRLSHFILKITHQIFQVK